MGQEQVKPQTIHPFWSPWAQGHTTPSCSVGGAGSLAQQSPTTLWDFNGEVDHLSQQPAPQPCEARDSSSNFSFWGCPSKPSLRKEQCVGTVPHAVLSSHHVFTAQSVWQNAQDQQLQKKCLFGSQFQPCQFLGAWPCCFGAGEEASMAEESCPFHGSCEAEHQGKTWGLVHPNDVTSSNKIPLQNFYPPSAGDQDFNMGILGHI